MHVQIIGLFVDLHLNGFLICYSQNNRQILPFCCSVVREMSDLWKKTARCKSFTFDNIDRISMSSDTVLWETIPSLPQLEFYLLKVEFKPYFEVEDIYENGNLVDIGLDIHHFGSHFINVTREFPDIILQEGIHRRRILLQRSISIEEKRVIHRHSLKDHINDTALTTLLLSGNKNDRGVLTHIQHKWNDFLKNVFQ